MVHRSAHVARGHPVNGYIGLGMGYRPEKKWSLEGLHGMQTP